MTNEQFSQRSNLPLEAKIIWSKYMIREFYDRCLGDVYMKKDDTLENAVLSKLLSEIYPHIETIEISENKYPICSTITYKNNIEKNEFIERDCNHYTEPFIRCKPLGFWTEKDIYTFEKLYIK